MKDDESAPPKPFRFREVGDTFEAIVTGFAVAIFPKTPRDLHSDALHLLFELRCDRCGRPFGRAYQAPEGLLYVGVHTVKVDTYPLEMDASLYPLALLAVDLDEGWHAAPCRKCSTYIGFTKADLIRRYQAKTGGIWRLPPMD